MSRHSFSRRTRRRVRKGAGRRLPGSHGSNNQTRPPRPASARDLQEKAMQAARERLIAEIYADPGGLMAQLTRLRGLPTLASAERKAQRKAAASAAPL